MEGALLLHSLDGFRLISVVRSHADLSIGWFIIRIWESQISLSAGFFSGWRCCSSCSSYTYKINIYWLLTYPLGLPSNNKNDKSFNIGSDAAYPTDNRIKTYWTVSGRIGKREWFISITFTVRKLYCKLFVNLRRDLTLEIDFLYRRHARCILLDWRHVSL